MGKTRVLLLCLYCHVWLVRLLAGQKLAFLAVGDFGGMPTYPYTTNTQRNVAHVMGKVAKERDARFIIGLGDNFYYSGVKSVCDPRFKNTFEDVFNAPALKAATWYMTAGNHDHAANVSAQIAYTNVSRRWHYPDFYYTAVEKIPGTSKTVQVVTIDTTLLCYYNKRHKTLDYPSPRRQLSWIENTLKYSTADYLLVTGHHPILSAGLHGNTRCLLRKLKPLLEEYNVTAYLCGHDHVQQHIQEKDSKIHLFVVGSGNFYTSVQLHRYTLPRDSLRYFNGNSGAFMLLEATPEELRTTQIDENHQELHTASIKPRMKPDLSSSRDEPDLLDEFFSLGNTD